MDNTRLMKIRILASICLTFGFALLMPTYSARPLGAATPQPTPRADPFATATPPTQAGHSENLFFVHCMPCHGDQGQGLTDEFRTRQYPPEDVNCWESGCHGDKPYDGGFTLPKTVPPIIGPDALRRFSTVADVYEFTRRAMPFNAPGSLSPTQYLQLTAFLMERNGVLPSGSALDPAAAATVLLREATPTPASPDAPAPASGAAALLALAALGIGVFGALGWLLRRKTREKL